MSHARAVLRARAPGKLNLCLFLGPTRERDGRHELVSVVQSLSLADELTLRPRLDARSGENDVVICPGVEGPNLAARALAAFRDATGWRGPPQLLEIDKRVPVAAGMGGGSADAAAALRLAAGAAGVDDDELLMRLAVGLGADVPAQVSPGRALTTGAGETVHRLASGREIGVLVLPGAEPLATPAVFAEADRLGLARDAGGLRRALDAVQAAVGDADRQLPLDLMVNELEPAARSLCPAIDVTLALAREAGADATLVSGSGPTVVGLFLGPSGARAAGEACRGLAARYPAARTAVPVDAGVAAVSVIRHND